MVRRRKVSGEETSPAQLPEDLIYSNILPRLPFRLLARCATICKAWRDVILRDSVFSRLQAQIPTPASAALARFHRGCLEVLTPGAADVAPPDHCLSFLPVEDVQRLRLCATTSGLLCLCLGARNDKGCDFFVVNPATRQFHGIPYDGAGVVVHTAGLAYDPVAAHREGYHLVVAAPQSQSIELYRFWRFSSREGAGAHVSGWWRASREAVDISLLSELHPKPSFVGGRLHWLSFQGNVVWYDPAADLMGKLSPPGKKPFESNGDLVEWRGRIGVACAGVSGLAVWALAGYGGGASPARWEMVHWRIWDEIPGVLRPVQCFLWSVVPVGLEPGGQEALGLAVRVAYSGVVPAKMREVWHRAVLRYDLQTGGTVTVAELGRKEIHNDLGLIFGYHSSMAELPLLNIMYGKYK